MPEIVRLLREAQREAGAAAEPVCAIIYALKRDTADDIAAALQAKGTTALGSYTPLPCRPADTHPA